MLLLASMSHVSPAFAPVFGNCVKLLRKVLYTTDGQPFLVAGSGTLGWDAVGANLIEKGDKAVSPSEGCTDFPFTEPSLGSRSSF